jgi:glycosyltransferase involved in cell wall biosynthesis
MRLSIVTAVLNSHEVVRRQILHYAAMDLPEVEIIFVDDGSTPPLQDDYGLANLTIFATNDFRPWTHVTARNTGAKIAKGDYLLLTDIDHIVSRQLIDDCLAFTGDILHFRREFGVLMEDGAFTQDHDILISYGVQPGRLHDGSRRVSPHGNSFCIKRELFWELGGMPAKEADHYPNREDGKLKRLIHRYTKRPLDIWDGHKRLSPIYLIPNGRFCGSPDANPFGLFHTLSRSHG